MANSWIDELGLKELGQRLGTGGSAGLAIGGGIPLIAALTGTVGGWLGWLLIPIAAMVGMVAGDYIKKDGYVFGEQGVIKALKNKNLPKNLPEGYIAATPYSRVTAANSEALLRRGEVHMPIPKYPDEVLFGFKELRPLDPFVEFSIKDDPRLEALKIKAKEYGRKYADAASPEYISDMHAREKKITNLVVKDIGDTYGSYSDDTMNWGSSSEYLATLTPRSIIVGGRTIELKETTKDSLVCRHYAPIVSVLLQEACVPNHLVSSPVMTVKNMGGFFEWDTSYDPVGKPTGHMYVITDKGNAVVEATVAGKEYADKAAYIPIVNGVTVEDIIYKGKSAIVETPDKQSSFIYGGHGGDGLAEANKSLWNAAASMFSSDTTAGKAMKQSIDEYNQKAKAQKELVEKVKTNVMPMIERVKDQVKTTLDGFKTLIPGDMNVESSSAVAPLSVVKLVASVTATPAK